MIPMKLKKKTTAGLMGSRFTIIIVGGGDIKEKILIIPHNKGNINKHNNTVKVRVIIMNVKVKVGVPA